MLPSPSAPASPPRTPPPAARAARHPALVPAVSRALTLLERLAQRGDAMSLAELTHDLALPKSSVHGLCNTLMSFGYLRRESDGAFRIGPGVMSLAEAFVAGTDVAREFHALWPELGDMPGETFVLSVLSGTDALYIAVRSSARPLGLAFNVGMRLPAFLSSSGKAMLAQLEPAQVRKLYADGLTPHLTRKGPREIDVLLKELELTRRRGWSVDDEAIREGVCAIGAPVFDASGRAVAGIAVCISKAQFGAERGERHRAALLRAARTLSQRLGGGGVGEPGGIGAARAHPRRAGTSA